MSPTEKDATTLLEVMRDIAYRSGDCSADELRNQARNVLKMLGLAGEG